MDAKLLMMAASGVGGDFYPYTVDNSCRFNDDDSAYLTRTPDSAGNRDVWTFSTWAKLGNAVNGVLFSAWAANSDAGFFSITFKSTGAIQIQGWNTVYRLTTALYIDPSAWYHVVVAVDTTDGTADNRIKLYVNGAQVTAFATNNAYTQNADTQINNTSAHIIGKQSNASDYFDGYLSQTTFIDGTALTPSSFGEDKNGIWVPKSVSGLTFGTNGAYLDFADSSALGNDVSGNNNDFTSSGLAAADQMIDTPTNNYPTLQAAFSTSATTYSNGNLEAQQDSGATKHTRATFGLPTTGKWYWEVQFIDARATDPPGTAFGIGVSDNDGLGDSGYSTGAILSTIPGGTTAYAYEDNAYTSGDNITVTAVVDGDWFGIAYDADTRKMWLWSERDNTWLASGDPANGTTPWKTLTALSADQTYFPIALTQTNDSGRWSKFGVNFGQYAFAGTAPTDFLQLNATNLPEPTIGPNSAIKPSDVFATVLYTGNGTAIGSGGKTISSLAFQPDFTWIKNRDAADSHMLFDAVRGATKYLESDTADAEATATESLASFTATGFTLGNNVAVNTNTEDYVAWNWKANGAGAANENGSINTTKTSANTDAGFSILQYTGNATDEATVGHGIGAVPKFGIFKMISQNAAAGYDVYVYHASAGQGVKLKLNTNGATSSSVDWPVAATTSLFTLGDGGGSNGDGLVYAAYLFAEVEGFSKFGSWVGASGAEFIYTGFRPAFVLTKRTNGSGWYIFDDARGFNGAIGWLGPNVTTVEGSTSGFQILSNGFRDSAWIGDAGETILYAAFAEQPFKYANAR